MVEQLIEIPSNLHKLKGGKHMDVSENSGTPKSVILIGFPL